jgi:hypothetical protein
MSARSGLLKNCHSEPNADRNMLWHDAVTVTKKSPLPPIPFGLFAQYKIAKTRTLQAMIVWPANHSHIIAMVLVSPVWGIPLVNRSHCSLGPRFPPLLTDIF